MGSEPARTTVVNVRGNRYLELINDPDFIYVGRTVRRTPWVGSKWGNPFVARTPEGVPEVLARYERHLRSTGLIDAIGELRGKRLGCWCCEWGGEGEPEVPCHAVVLARLANAIEEDAP